MSKQNSNIVRTSTGIHFYAALGEIAQIERKV